MLYCPDLPAARRGRRDLADPGQPPSAPGAAALCPGASGHRRFAADLHPAAISGGLVSAGCARQDRASEHQHPLPVCAIYSVGYLFYRQERSNRVLCIGLLVCLSAMSLVTITHHLGLMWVALETTTISMAPLIYFNRNARSIEATWKYLLICSVGIALALLGLYFLAYSTIVARAEPSLLLDDLIRRCRPALLRLAACRVRLPAGRLRLQDGAGAAAHLETGCLRRGARAWSAPCWPAAWSICAFLALLRVYQICLATKEIAFFQNALVVMGLISMVFAAVFMARQADFKRMLAYSSVEHVGILAVALGLGKKALFGALFHMLATTA